MRRHLDKQRLLRTQRARVLIAGTIAGTIICGCGLAGCSGSGSSSASSSAPGVAALPAAGTAQGAADAPAGGSGFGAASGSGSSSSSSAAGTPESAASKLIPSAESIIYTAQLTVRAKNVSTALGQATQIVSATGGDAAADNASQAP